MQATKTSGNIYVLFSNITYVTIRLRPQLILNPFPHIYIILAIRTVFLPPYSGHTYTSILTITTHPSCILLPKKKLLLRFFMARSQEA